MAESVYRVTEVIGVSSESWEAAARTAVETAAKTVRDLRVAEVIRQDLTIADGGVVNFRVRPVSRSSTAPRTRPAARAPRAQRPAGLRPQRRSAPLRGPLRRTRGTRSSSLKRHE
jgi:dodecin